MWYEKKNHQLLLLGAICLFSFFINNGFLEPEIMEARNFITAKEMVDGGSWLVPTMNGEYRLAKPPLPTWITACFGLIGGNIYNEVALRLPAAIMGLMMVYFLFLFTRTITKDKLIPFLAAAVLSTSFYVVFMARQGTWDIYTHSFMLGAIWAFSKGWNKDGKAYGEFLLAGILMGLSFMSKGPVSFYALLLPFLISYLVAFGPGKIIPKWKEMLAGLAVCILLSSWWPIYTYLEVPSHLLENINTETGSWRNRHVRPFWHYWNFPVQAGLWALFITAALVVPYAKDRISQVKGNYKFLIWWVLTTIVLLSLVPEKKERYLMPGLISQALLTAFYLKYLISSFKQGQQKSPDKIILIFSSVLFGLICLTVPWVLYQYGFRLELLSVWVFGMCSLVFLALALVFILSIRKVNPITIVASVICLSCFLSLTTPYLLGRMFKRPPEHAPLEAITLHQELLTLPAYSVGSLRPEELWDMRRIVSPLYGHYKEEAMGQDSILVFTPKHLQHYLLSSADKATLLRNIGVYEHHTRDGNIWYASVLKPNKWVIDALTNPLCCN